MQSLSITQPQAEILTILERKEACNIEVVHLTGLPEGTVSGSLARMEAKGWLHMAKVELEKPTPIVTETTYYSLSELGCRALAAWRVYTET